MPKGPFYIKTKIDNAQQNIKCGFCGDRDEIVNCMISKYSQLPQNEYK